MMGQSIVQDQLFYTFNLRITSHALTCCVGIDRFLDLGDLRQHLAPFYSHTGRPSIDPELMIRMLVIGYCLGIRSERRPCEEVDLSLAYRWFCRPALEDRVLDPSTFSKNRHGRFRQSDALRFAFQPVLRRCMREGLVQGEGFVVDASIIKADANRARNLPASDLAQWRQDTQCNRALREYLHALDVQNPVTESSASTSSRDGSWVTPRTAPRHCSAGWSRARRSNLTCRCGTRPCARTEACPSASSGGSPSAMNMFAAKATCCVTTGGSSRRCAPASPKPTPSSIGEPGGLHGLRDEGSLLPEQAIPEDRPQHP